MQKPIPAATLIVFRHGRGKAAGGPPEVLMIRRSRELAFAPGAAVFPGGRVDPQDAELAITMPGDADWNAARVAAIRETLEEAGLLTGVAGDITAAKASAAREALLNGKPFGDILSEQGWSIDADALAPFARWRPAVEVPRSFDTRFFITDLGTGAVEISHDGTETKDLFWATAEDLVERSDRDDIAMMFPTRQNLLRIARFPDFAAVREHALSVEPHPVKILVEDRNGDSWMRVADGQGYEGVFELAYRARRHN